PERRLLVPRLPKPGGDAGNWGEILNEYLSVEHDDNGTLKPSGSLSTKYTKPASGIPESDLHPDIKETLSKTQEITQAVDALTPGSGEIVTGGPVGEPIAQGFGGSFLPLRNVTYSALSTGSIMPIDAIGDTLYGHPVGVGPEIAQLHRSTDGGETWEHVNTISAPAGAI